MTTATRDRQTFLSAIRSDPSDTTARNPKKTKSMKSLTLTCIDCGHQQRFEGRDVQAVMRAIDNSGWQDFPSDTPRGQLDGRCPKCVAAIDDSWLGEPA